MAPKNQPLLLFCLLLALIDQLTARSVYVRRMSAPMGPPVMKGEMMSPMMMKGEMMMNQLVMKNEMLKNQMGNNQRPMKNTTPFFTIRGPEILTGFPIPLEVIPGGSDNEFDKQTTSDELNFLIKYPLQYALNPMVRAGIGTLNKIEMYGAQLPLHGNLIFSPIFRAITQPASFNFERPFEMVL